MSELNLKIRKANLGDVTSLLQLYAQVDELHYQELPEIFNQEALSFYRKLGYVVVRQA